MITKSQVVPLLLEACPTARSSWEDHLAWWKGEEAGSFNDVSVFAHHIVEGYAKGLTAECAPFFATVERIIEEGDEQARELATTGVLEDIQVVSTHYSFGPTVFVRWLGPRSQQAWNQIETVWAAGGGSLAGVIRLERRLRARRNTMIPTFSIEILDQGWLVPSEPEADLCSHGRLRLLIGGHDVIDAQESYGVSESALAMLRTLGSDHTTSQRVADRMVFHGCGSILMMGCPIGVDFSVRHGPEGVTISDVVRYDTTNDAEVVRFQGLSVTVSEDQYRRAVLEFARRAQQPFVGAVKRFEDEFDAMQYREFWAEFNEIVARYGQDVA